MNDQLEMIPGTNRDTSKSQYFTPTKLAQRVVEWALGPDRDPTLRPWRVLEPSAGNGALVRPLVAAGAEVDAIELDTRYRDELCDLMNAHRCNHVWCGDNFLEVRPGLIGPYDLCVMNPPYHDNLAAEFVRYALLFAPRVVGIFQADIFYTVGRYDGLWTHARPTRAAMLARRPWPGETDYVVLEIVKRREWVEGITPCTIEFWPDAWR